jgi:hypothetical protein
MVVVGLMLVLASLAVLLIPRVNSEQQATRAAAQLQQWFEMAKQRAARDRAPRGVRLLAGNAANPTFVTDLVFLVQADDYYLGSVVGTDPTTTLLSRATLGAGGKVSFDMVVQKSGTVSATAPPRTLTGGQTNASLYPVQPGDRIVFDGGSTVYEIAAVSPLGAPGGSLTTTVPFPALVGYTTTQYLIIRQPRPDGDEPLQMPNNVVIDCTAKGIQGGIYDLLPKLSSTVPQPANTVPHYDIMFAPDGRVIGTFANQEILIFWVRDVTLAGDQGDPTLVVIYPRTGSVAAQPVDLTGYNGTFPNPYTFAKTGIRSSQ